jgi:hypothetical protein
MKGMSGCAGVGFVGVLRLRAVRFAQDDRVWVVVREQQQQQQQRQRQEQVQRHPTLSHDETVRRGWATRWGRW